MIYRLRDGMFSERPSARAVESHWGSAMKQDTCYYDARCGLCRRTTRVLRRLDWLGALRFEDMNTARDLPVPLAAAMEGMPMRTHDDRTLIGFSAVRRALIRTPIGALFAWILYVPGLGWLAQRVYRHVAATRRRDAACGAGL